MWKVNIKELVTEKRKKIEGIYNIEEIELHTGKYKVLHGGFNVKLVLTYADNKILLGGYARGYVERSCDRCLKISEMYIDGIVEAVYTFEKKVLSKNEELKDLTNDILLTGDIIDLEERIIEGIVSSAPDVFLCKPDCKGLCPYCGADLNEEPDHHCTMSEEKIDPRFEILLKIKDKQEG
ncbi:MAG: YceD family protein [Fervidobacterium pennivorans]